MILGGLICYLTLTNLAAAALLSACGSGALETQAQLLTREWDQAEPVTVSQNGSTLKLTNGELDFYKNGTSESEGLLTFEGVPEQITSYKIASKATYSLNAGRLTETTTDLSVVPTDSNPDSQQMATDLRDMMGTVKISTLEIVSIDKDRLVLRDSNSDVVMTYNRD